MSEFTLSIYADAKEPSVRVIGPAGRSPAEGNVSLEFGAPSDGSMILTSWLLDSENLMHYFPRDRGLARVVTRFRDTGSKSLPLNVEPNYSAEATVAVSSSVPTSGPIVLHAVRHGGGSICALVKDVDGRPVRATVVISDTVEPTHFSSDTAKFAGSTDDKGQVVFPDLPPGSYTLTASILGPSRTPALGGDGEPFPSDAALIGVSQFVPQTVTVASNRETSVVLRAQQLGYVRGYVRVTGSLMPFELPQPRGIASNPRVRFDRSTGEFVAGPFVGGPANLSLWPLQSLPNEDISWWDTSIDVAAGKVTRVSLAPEGIAGNSAAEPLTPMTRHKIGGNLKSLQFGRVFLADGVTPAWGARLVASKDGKFYGDSFRADAAGSFLQDGGRYADVIRLLNLADPLRGASREPIVVVWLPGSTGAIITPNLRGTTAPIVLPAPIALRGHVTVGRKTVAGINSTFRITAAYQGQGQQNLLLCREATAQTDGSFSLDGLTPGTYKVQASRDGIWLSPTQTLTVHASATLPEIMLDIPLPGQAVDLQLTDAKGNPMPGAEVTISRPDGPLTDAVWPATFTADGAGDLHLEGLNAGSETVTVFSAPDRGSYDYGPPVRKPLKKLVIDVPLFAVGAPAILQTIRAD